MKKVIRFDRRAEKEILAFPQSVQTRIKAILTVLSTKVILAEPDGKKLDTNLFELRIRHRGQWRVLYAYHSQTLVVVLSAFKKETQKTPTQQLRKAKNRLANIKL